MDKIFTVLMGVKLLLLPIFQELSMKYTNLSWKKNVIIYILYKYFTFLNKCNFIYQEKKSQQKKPNKNSTYFYYTWLK